MPDGLRPVTFQDLAGWRNDRLNEALACFQLSAQRILTESDRSMAWQRTAKAALSASDARHFFERNFEPHMVCDAKEPDNLFTGYFEPEVEGALTPSQDFTVPLYKKPGDLLAFPAGTETRPRYGRLINGKPQNYFTRKQIEQGALKGQGLEICWLKSFEDAFFMQVQGSGRVRLPDGSTLRLTYAAKSGLPYTSIGKVLTARGVFKPGEATMQTLRKWMAENPKASRELMWENESFVFFRSFVPDNPHLGAIGAGKTQLTPLRSLAIDRKFWDYGTPVWLETEIPARSGSESFNRLLIAQDTGSAIRGRARGDIYFGWGDEAAFRAGQMQAKARMVVLLPLSVA